MKLNFLLAQFYVGCGHLGTEKYDDAVEMPEKCNVSTRHGLLGVPTRSVIMHYFLGQAYEAAEQSGNAIEQYETFLEIRKNADSGIVEIENAEERLANLKNDI